MGFGARQQGRQYFGVLRTAVVVGQPDPIGAGGQRVKDAQRETTCATEVSA